MTDTPKRLPMSEFIAAVVGDPANPPQVRLLIGYLGAAAAEGQTRVYFDPQLASYQDFATDDILHAVEGDGAGPLRAAYIWVRSPATQAQPSAGALLQGGLTDALMGNVRAVRPGLEGGGGPTNTSVPALCQTVSPPCTIAPNLCPSQLCPSHYGPCGVGTGVSPPTVAPVLCATALPGTCPSTLTACPPLQGGAGMLPQGGGGGLSTRVPAFCQTYPPQCIPDTVNPPCIPQTVYSCS